MGRKKKTVAGEKPRQLPPWAENLENMKTKWGGTLHTMALLLLGDESKFYTAGKWLRGESEPGVEAFLRLQIATGIPIPALYFRIIPTEFIPPQPLTMNTNPFPAADSLLGEPNPSDFITPKENKANQAELADLRAALERLRLEKIADVGALARVVEELQRRIEALERGKG